MGKNSLRIVSLNFLKDRHEELLKWIDEESNKREQSISSFCISIIKEYYTNKKENK